MTTSKVSYETCGVVGHEPECLCDVVITTPTEIAVDAVKGMWMGELLCENRGFVGREWDDESIVQYLTELLVLHDAWIDLGPDAFIQASESSTDHRHYSRWMKIRRVVKRALAIEPRPKIADVLRSLGVTAEEFTGAVTTNKCVLSAEQLDLFESLIVDSNNTWADVAGATGVSRHSVRTFYYYWFDAPPAIRSTDPSSPHRVRMGELIDKGLTNKEIKASIYEEFGIKMSSGAISHARTRRNK